MSITSTLHTIGRTLQRSLRGEPVTLHTAGGATTAEISDAVVSLDPPAGLGKGEGNIERMGVLRLNAAHHAAASTAATATVRGEIWHVVAVTGVDDAGTCRAELRRDADDTENSQSNLFDLSNRQAVFHDQ